jgi:hypothetical protein
MKNMITRKKAPQTQNGFDREQRAFLLAKIRSLSSSARGQLNQTVRGTSPDYVKQAERVIEKWNEEKQRAKIVFENELDALADEAREAVLFGTKDEVDACIKRINDAFYRHSDHMKVKHGTR